MNTKANILRIERISPSDGKGLRTVVFFKGCPLRCAWCSTPESQLAAPEVYYQKERCRGCGKCIPACPNGALSLEKNGKDFRIVRDKEKCTNCFSCVRACNPRAMQVYGKEMTVKQVFKEILKDEVFYFHSGGGVTLSGGDVICYPEFAEKLLAECKEYGINTSAELAMHGPYERIERLLPYLDSFFADVKLMDSDLHQKWTGVPNETILENLKKAAAQCKKDAIHIRVPLIWGVNDTCCNIKKTAQFCKELPNCCELEFLPYHRLGQHGYRNLDRAYELEHLPTMTYDEAWKKVSFLCSKEWPFTIKISGKTIYERN